MKDKIKLPLSYKDAKEIMLYFHKDVNMALDYGDAFVFSNKSQANSINDYGWAIKKDTGKIIQMGQYLYSRNTNASPKSIPF